MSFFRSSGKHILFILAAVGMSVMAALEMGGMASFTVKL
jgi:hypothetical protein